MSREKYIPNPPAAVSTEKASLHGSWRAILPKRPRAADHLEA